MSTSEVRSKEAASDARIGLKIGVVVIPVSDADRFDNGFRVVQFTPERRALSSSRRYARSGQRTDDDRPRGARKAHWAARRELVRLVRRVHSGGADR